MLMLASIEPARSALHRHLRLDCSKSLGRRSMCSTRFSRCIRRPACHRGGPTVPVLSAGNCESPVLAASPARTDTTASWAVPSKSPADRSAESPARWGFRRLGNDDDGAAASAAFAVTPNHAENEPSVARPRRASHRGGANDRKRSGFSDHGGCSGYVTLTEMEGPPSPPSPPEPPEPGSPSRCRSHPTRPTSRRRRRSSHRHRVRRHLRARRPRRHRRRCCEAEGRRSRRSRRSRRRLRHHRGATVSPGPTQAAVAAVATRPAVACISKAAVAVPTVTAVPAVASVTAGAPKPALPCAPLVEPKPPCPPGRPTRRRRRHLRRRQALRQNPRDK